MGLIDQVLGQVIGSMAGGARGREAGGTTGGGLGDIIGQVLGRGDAQASGRMQAPPGSDVSSRGGLGDLLGGLGGRLSPLVLAALAVLASKHLGSGAGGLGSILRDAVTGGGARRPEDDDPTLQMPGGYEAAPGEDPGVPYDEPGRDYAPGGSGGFLDEVGSMLDGPGGGPPRAGGGDVFGDLQRRFDDSGQGDLMGSWIGSGANREPSADELERALGPDVVDDLARRFGLDRGEMLHGLTRALPQVVDGLTPQGRVPSAEERRGWV